MLQYIWDTHIKGSVTWFYFQVLCVLWPAVSLNWCFEDGQKTINESFEEQVTTKPNIEDFQLQDYINSHIWDWSTSVLDSLLTETDYPFGIVPMPLIRVASPTWWCWVEGRADLLVWDGRSLNVIYLLPQTM